MNINYVFCIDALGLTANSYRLSQSPPPHTITSWSGPDPQPTEAEFQAVWDAHLEAEPMRLLRAQRNSLIAVTDWWGVSDRVMTQAQQDYRQALRDLPATASPTLDESGQLADVVWPEKPE